MQYGAESAVVVDLSKRLGLALGMNSVECSLNFNAITLTTIRNERCITTTRDTINQSINVNLLVQIQQIVNKTEAVTDNHNNNNNNNNNKLNHELTDRTILAFDELDKTIYPTWLVGLFVGTSCAAFAYLNGGSWSITAVTFIAGMVAMFTRI